MIYHKLHTAIICIFLTLLVAVPGVFAQTTQSSDRTEALLDLLVGKGILSKEEADAFRMESAAIPSGADEQLDSARGLNAEQDDVRQEIRQVEEKLDRMTEQLLQTDRLTERKYEELEDKVNEDLLKKIYNSSWAQRISIGGDMRLRYEATLYDDENASFLDPADPTSLLNSTVDRNRFRYRFRLDTKAKVIDSREINVGKAEIGLRLSSGNDDDPISTNDTLGDYQNKDGILIDRAYLKYTYAPIEPFWGIIPQMVFTGGRIPNPWYRGSTLVWDDDLNFEGGALNFKSDIQDWRKWGVFLTVGAFSIQEEEWSNKDKWLYGAQVGFEWIPNGDFTGTFSAAYFDYANITGTVNSTLYPDLYDFTAPDYQTKGNTLIDIDPTSDIQTALAADYNLINATLKAEYSRFYPINLVVEGEGVYNIGFDKDVVSERTGSTVPEDIFGYQIGFKIGYSKIREYGEWSTSLEYRYLESDAVLDAFTDSDFHGGGTNAEGWGLGIEYGLFKDIWMKLKWLTADETSDSSPQLAIDVLQVDLNARF